MMTINTISQACLCYFSIIKFNSDQLNFENELSFTKFISFFGCIPQCQHFERRQMISKRNWMLFYEYCNLWKLKVNTDKTKVMVFGNGRLPQYLSFSYDNLNLEIVKNFNYLGIIFTRTGNFSLTKKTSS